MGNRVLILGGTAEARQIAAALHVADHDVTTSIAGVTTAPEIPAGKLRVGGFGGAQGLRDYIAQQEFDTVIDATHPFAVNISRNLESALHELPVRFLSFMRNAWVKQDGDRWEVVGSYADAVARMPSGARVFLAIGRKELAPFIRRTDVSGVVRSIEPPNIELGPQWVQLYGKPGTNAEAETKLLREFGITHLVCKNSGGSSSAAKLEACARLSIQVIMIAAPTKARGVVCRSVEEVMSVIKMPLDPKRFGSK